jgi:serine/threonine protein kinase
MAPPGERYELLRPNSSSGMATIHVGHALGAGGLQRLVAIEVMHPHLAGQSELSTTFLDEARLVARIRHLNVVRARDVRTDDQGEFFVKGKISYMAPPPPLAPPTSTASEASPVYRPQHDESH